MSWIVSCCAMLALIAGAARASTLYYTDFPESTGSFPTGWTTIIGSTGDPGWHIDFGGDLRFNDSGNGSSALGDSFVLNDSSTAADLTNVIVTTTFRKGTNLTGLITHHPGGSGTSETFYHARLNGSSSLQLYAFSGGATQLGSTVSTSDTYDTGEQWKLRMTTLGGKDAQQVGALVYNQFGQLVGKIRHTTSGSEPVLTSGSAGVRGGNPSIWENFSISTPTQITTAVGQGADSYIEFRSDQSGQADSNKGGADTVQAKSGDDSEQIYRKAYLRYDLTSLGADEVFSASLDLQVNDRNSSSTTFNVYGLIDGVSGDDDPSGSGWIETGTGGITWNNAPGNDTGTGVDADATLLGSFTGGSNDELLRFTSEALVDFLNTDTNGLVTFIITAPNPGGFADSNFLQFDSKEQSGGIAPTLSLVAIPEPGSLAVLIGMILGVFRRQLMPVRVATGKEKA